MMSGWLSTSEVLTISIEYGSSSGSTVIELGMLTTCGRTKWREDGRKVGSWCALQVRGFETGKRKLRKHMCSVGNKMQSSESAASFFNLLLQTPTCSSLEKCTVKVRSRMAVHEQNGRHEQRTGVFNVHNNGDEDMWEECMLPFLHSVVRNPLPRLPKIPTERTLSSLMTMVTHLVILDDLSDEVSGVHKVSHNGHTHAQCEHIGVLLEQTFYDG
eukprot:scaffold131004_cov21-Tisochrysis_lutea.AAC.1